MLIIHLSHVTDRLSPQSRWKTWESPQTAEHDTKTSQEVHLWEVVVVFFQLRSHE